MSTLDELKLGAEEEIKMPEEIPEEKDRRVELAQPGRYVFQLPDNMETVWGTFDNKKKGQRIFAAFNQENSLVIRQDPDFDGHHVGRPVSLLLNNLEYPRGVERTEVSDMTYLIRALEAHLDTKSKLKYNADYAEALKQYAGAMFEAELSWNAYCNKGKDIYMNIRDGEGKVIKADAQPGQLGCGSSYNTYSREANERIPQDGNGWFVERFEETDVQGDEFNCPAVLFSNARLARFKAVTG